MSSFVGTHLTLTPTSTPAEIYAQIGCLKELRRQSNLFEADLSEQQLRGSTAEKGDGGVKQHSTCFKLYQAVRSLKKRDNKKDTKERLYPTLAAAFDAHRRRTLNQDSDAEESSHYRSAEQSTSHRTTINLSHPPSSSVSAMAIPTAAAAAATALPEAAPQSIHVASSSAGSHSSHNGETSSASLNHSSDSAAARALQASDIPRHREEMDEIRRVLHQLLESTSRVHAKLKAVEEEVCSMQTQLGGCQQLLTTWELKAARDPAEDQEPIAPAETALSSAFPIGIKSPSSPPPLPTAQSVQAEPVMKWKEAAETVNHANFRSASPSPSSCNDDGADDNAETQNDDGGDVVVDEPQGMSGVRGVESENNARYDSNKNKRSRSPSEDGEVSPKRQQCNAPSGSGHQAADGAVVDATTVSDGRCVWVQSQSEMCTDDLMMIFSHFGRVERVDVPRPRPGHLPFAFVHFEAEEDARWSIRRAMDGAFGCLMVKAYQQRRQARRPSRRIG